MEQTYYVWNDEWYADMCYEGWKTFTTAELISLFTLLQCDGGTELGHLVTTLTDDSYADNLVDAVRDIHYECEGDREQTLRLCEEDKTVLTCKTYWRCMQIGAGEQIHTDEVLEKVWRENIIVELESIECDS